MFKNDCKNIFKRYYYVYDKVCFILVSIYFIVALINNMLYTYQPWMLSYINVDILISIHCQDVAICSCSLLWNSCFSFWSLVLCIVFKHSKHDKDLMLCFSCHYVDSWWPTYGHLAVRNNICTCYSWMRYPLDGHNPTFFSSQQVIIDYSPHLLDSDQIFLTPLLFHFQLKLLLQVQQY